MRVDSHYHLLTSFSVFSASLWLKQLKEAGKIGDETYFEAVATNMSYTFITIAPYQLVEGSPL